MQMALALAPRGDLRLFVNGRPRWYRRIGRDVVDALRCGDWPRESELRMLCEVYDGATALRDWSRKAEQLLSQWGTRRPRPGRPRRGPI